MSANKSDGLQEVMKFQVALAERVESLFEFQSSLTKLVMGHIESVEQIESLRAETTGMEEGAAAELNARLADILSRRASRCSVVRQQFGDVLAREEMHSDRIKAQIEQWRAMQNPPGT